MGMTKNQLELVSAVAKNNFQRAKQCALACCAEDTTQKNKYDVAYYQNLLKNEELHLIELPVSIQNFSKMEDLSLSYNENRYYLSDRERELFRLIQRMNQVSLQLMEKQIPYLNATLLYGESGVGKTAFSKYVAYKLDLPYLYVNFSQMIDSHLGGTAKNLTQLFQYISQQKCVVMLDELDSLTTKRTYANDSVGAEVARSTTCLLQLLDSLSNHHIILAATNLPDSLDDALKRRFTEKHEIVRLTEKERKAFVKQYMNDVGFVYEGLDEFASQDRSQAEILKYMARRIADMLLKDKSVVRLTE